MLRTITIADIVDYAENNRNPSIRKKRFIQEQPKLTKDLRIVIRLARRFTKSADIVDIFAQYIGIMYTNVFHTADVFYKSQPHLKTLIDDTTSIPRSKQRLIACMVDNVFVIYDILKRSQNTLVN